MTKLLFSLIDDINLPSCLGTTWVTGRKRENRTNWSCGMKEIIIQKKEKQKNVQTFVGMKILFVLVSQGKQGTPGDVGKPGPMVRTLFKVSM